MNNLDKQYIDLLQDILHNGIKKSDRTGTGTLSVFGRQIRHRMSEGFPLLTTKKMPWKQIVTELLWFLRGDTNIRYLVDNGCNIWNGDAYKNYTKKVLNMTSIEQLGYGGYIIGNDGGFLPFSLEEFIYKIKEDKGFAKQWGELGPIYGKQWRNWYSVAWEKEQRQKEDSVHNHIDQISNLINDLKKNPDSRRLMVNAWNVGEIEQAVLPPCHYGFQVWTRELNKNQGWERYQLLLKKISEKELQTKYRNDERGTWIGFKKFRLEDANYICDNENIPKRTISLMWNQRSCDFPLGIPFNIASYGLLLMILAKYVNMVPDELIGNLGDCHIYLNQIEGIKEQIIRTSFDLPIVAISDKIVNDVSEYDLKDFSLIEYQSHPKISFPLSN